ncbi:type II secretion system protein GspC [Vibrio gallicus]|uniref:type II secretion system protein GspC n=1 Tax=Vibrio gallicus TaxID=190897 RepID=UPI0021C49F32|nr:type II secretion system protein GspC [Vibrio gallicus]
MSYSQRLNQILTALINRQAQIAGSMTLIFMVLSAWIAGFLFWQFMNIDSGVERWRPSSQTVTAQKSNTKQLNMDQLLDADLFGKEEQKPVVAVKQVVDAPKTRLNLVLVGVVASSNTKNSLAVIANRGSQGTYGIGEKIEGTRVTLSNVLGDRVIIDNQGRNETLMLEGLEYKKVDAAQQQIARSQSQSNVQGNNPKLDVSNLESIKEAISENPQQFLKYIRLSQVNRDGKLVGYRVRPGRDRALFDSVGLKDGDIAVELNGADLTDPKSMGEIWKSLNQLTELNLTVERDGQRYDIYLQF